MAVYYARDGEKAAGRIEELLAEMRTAYPAEAQKWAEIMDRWRTLEDRVTVNTGVLPDGLPDTKELCIVALGYRLNADGTMKNQLKDRLKVVIKSAKKYRNAWVVCTGGSTASKKKNVTEAGKMEAYLKKKGISKGRILAEKGSYTTAQNARKTLAMLEKYYPEVKYIAVVTSDYHVRTGVLYFEAESILRSEPGGSPRFTVVSNAGHKTSTSAISRLSQAGGLIELAGNRETAVDLYHNRYDLKQWPSLGE